MHQRDRATYATLDGLRAAAAVMVVLFHSKTLSGSWCPTQAYSAVDLFFVLSGCVIDSAYTSRLERGMGAGRFIKIRLVRLWPLYAAGLALGAAWNGLLLLRGIGYLSSSLTIWSTLAGLLLLPAPLAANRIAPLNLPAWSLLFEWTINLVFVAVARFLRKSVLILIIALSGAELAHLTFLYQSMDHGYEWSRIDMGAARVTFSFFLGILLHRLPRPKRRQTLLALLLPLCVLLVIALPPAGIATDLLRAALIYPFMIWLGLWVEPSARLERVFRLGGRLSYPIYIVHLPIVDMFAPSIAKRLHSDLLRKAISLALVAALIGFSWLLNRFYDRPIRDRLAGALNLEGVKRTLPAEPAASAP